MTMRRIGKRTSVALAAMIVASALPATAQQMGHDPYAGPARTPSMAAQFEFQQRMQSSGASNTSAAQSALQQYVTSYSSSSTSIGTTNSEKP